MTDLLRRLFEAGQDAALTYEESRTLAAHDDVTVRRELARRTDVRPEVLYYLAEDSDAQVRRNIAGNAAAPIKAYLLLSDDTDPDVRLTLVERITELAPGLSEGEQDRVHRQVHDVLSRLARDQIPRVRALLSELLKDLADAPGPVIRRLARDVEIAVSAPVLTFSPVLSDQDLLEIIHAPPTDGALGAIARRPAGLAEPVTDAIAASDDIPAITDMLANQGAQIREETLDCLIDRAGAVPAWHAPLVARPRLHADAGRRLAMFVSDTLVQALMLRRDLAPGDAMAVASEVRRRLGREGDGNSLIDYGPNWREDLIRIAAQVRDELESVGAGAGAEMLRGTMATGDRVRAIAVVAALAGVSPLAVAAAVRTASAKGMASLAWKAGLSAETATALQGWLAGVPPDEILSPHPESGAFPLREAEMEWQVEMFCETEARESAGEDLPGT
ncbi:DUF2336 domain-containing protein [Roseospira navarrensis]|uniref:DUF2336 domain-containing protein n=1 Tax=Roseospira navarrensis TaxID=140058 RepID=A0A7X1ZG76_9PROT|nr:DUF2336 domain-containing protein [Roseospira navarrensis]MQX37743.1 DUF2336 domain-containing protein [Roseospira navarrensis]